jgi:hypothetical protein
MTRWLKIVGLVLLSLASAFWLLLAFRLLAVPLLFAFFISISLRCLRARPAVPVLLWFVFFGSTWLPFDVTLLTAPDGPKFVGCCPGAWRGRTHETALAMERRGECVLCSDLVSGFEPSRFLVW